MRVVNAKAQLSQLRTDSTAFGVTVGGSVGVLYSQAYSSEVLLCSVFVS